MIRPGRVDSSGCRWYCGWTENKESDALLKSALSRSHVTWCSDLPPFKRAFSSRRDAMTSCTSNVHYSNS